MNIFVNKKVFTEENNEFVERKGLGHPDTLADALAEKLSVEYSKYTLKKYGAILHHNFDKVGLLGGSAYVVFGKGYLTKPIRILLNGRASTKFFNKVIPVKQLLYRWTKEFIKNKLPLVDVDKDLEFHFNISNQSSPGKTNELKSETGTRKYWFEPRGLFDIQELSHLLANDTSLGVGYAPLTRLENFVLSIEKKLSSPQFKKNNQWIGSDIKIMGFRHASEYFITLCIPQISRYVKNIKHYKTNLAEARNYIRRIAKQHQIEKLELNINTRDNFDNYELYLTAIGSSIESGDEGLVGRGNRINGLISPLRPMSMEGSCGKNPVYHIGKIYYLLASEMANKINKKFNAKNEVMLISQSGRNLLDPWIVVVNISKKPCQCHGLKKLIDTEIKKIPLLTNGLLEEKFMLI